MTGAVPAQPELYWLVGATAGVPAAGQVPAYGAPLVEERGQRHKLAIGDSLVPDRLRPLLAAMVTVLALAGCGGGEPEAISTPVLPSPAPSSRATSSPAAATPTSPGPSPTAFRSPSAGPSAASTEDGTYANDLSVSEDGALSYVPLRWYAGPNAMARCREKGIQPEGAWCTQYYYEEDGGRKAATLTESTRVRLLNDDLKPADASLADLVQAIEDENWPNYQIAVSGGRVTQITQVFTP